MVAKSPNSPCCCPLLLFAPQTSGVEMLAPYIKTLLILESSPSLFFPIALSSDFTKIFSSTFNLSSHFLNFTELREASSLYRFLIHPLTPFPRWECLFLLHNVTSFISPVQLLLVAELQDWEGSFSCVDVFEAK